MIKNLKTPGGCSLKAIIKGLKSEFGEVAPHALGSALKKGTETTVLVQEGERWWVKGHEPPLPSNAEKIETLREQLRESERHLEHLRTLPMRIGIGDAALFLLYGYIIYSIINWFT